MVLRCNLKSKICFYKNKEIDLGFYYSMQKKYKFNEINFSKIKGTSFIDLSVFVNEKFYYLYNTRQLTRKDKFNNVFKKNDSTSFFPRF